MNILLDGLPTAIEVAGEVCEINADYRTALRIITAFEAPELTGSEKAAVLVSQLYKQPPGDYQAAVSQGVKFLDCGDSTGGGDGGSGERTYSFAHDARYIYAAVDRVLGGRLNRGGFVHWWEFVTAFMELPEDCMMSRILYLRTQRSKGKLTKEERQQWAQMRDVLELPVELTAEEQQVEAEFMRLLKG